MSTQIATIVMMYELEEGGGNGGGGIWKWAAMKIFIGIISQQK